MSSLWQIGDTHSNEQHILCRHSAPGALIASVPSSEVRITAPTFGLQLPSTASPPRALSLPLQRTYSTGSRGSLGGTGPMASILRTLQTSFSRPRRVGSEAD